MSLEPQLVVRTQTGKGSTARSNGAWKTTLGHGNLSHVNKSVTTKIERTRITLIGNYQQRC